MLTTLVLLLRCVQTTCVSLRERAGERELAMCFPYIIKRNFVVKTWTRSVNFMRLLTVFICLASVVVGFWLFFCYKTFEITRNNLAK